MESEIFINANERIAYLTEYLEKKPTCSRHFLGVDGDQVDQAESQAFLSSAFTAALVLCLSFFLHTI